MTIKELLDAARQLPEDDRRQLLTALQDAEVRQPTDAQRREAMSAWLDLAGAFHSRFTDVSSDKYRHLADVYGDER